MLQTCSVYASVLSFVLDARYQKLVELSTPDYGFQMVEVYNSTAWYIRQDFKDQGTK